MGFIENKKQLFLTKYGLIFLNYKLNNFKILDLYSNRQIKFIKKKRLSISKSS